MHPRPVGVENTQNSCVCATRRAVGRCYRFGVTFSLVVDASRSDRVDVAPIFLPLRVQKGFTINLTTRGEDKACGFAQGEIEHVPRSLRPGPQGEDGPVQVRERRCWAGKMNHTIESALDINRLQDALLDD